MKIRLKSISKLFCGIILFILVSPVQLFQFLFSQPLKFQGHHQEPKGLFLNAFAGVLMTMDEALKELMPKGAQVERDIQLLSSDQIDRIEAAADLTIDRAYNSAYEIFIGREASGQKTYVIRDAVVGKWGLIHYVVALNSSGEVQKVIVLEYQEKRGKPVAKKRFLKQFIGKTITDRVKIRKDIRGVAGASISSNGITSGVRKILHVFKELYG